jgi:hypothetical protein
MTNADCLDVVAHRVQDEPNSDPRIKASNQRPRPRLHTQHNKNDRSGESCLSKIAHIWRLRWQWLRRGRIKYLFFGTSNALLLRIGSADNIRSDGAHSRPGIFEFLSTLQADLIGPLVDCEHTTFLAVTTSEYKLENPKQEFHKSSALCRRSQLPLTSNQSSKARTLARARAIAQSAAP